MELVITSEGAEVRKQIWLWLPRRGRCRFDAGVLPEVLERIPLHLQVRRDIPVRGRDAGMTEIIADYSHVGARLQERDCAAVPENVRGDAVTRQPWPILDDCRGMLGKDVRSSIAG